MKVLVGGLLFLVIFSVLISGCTDVSDQFKKEVEHSNSVLTESAYDLYKTAEIGGGNLPVLKTSATKLDREVQSAKSRIESISGTNETLKQKYIKGLNHISEGALLVLTIDPPSLLNAKTRTETAEISGIAISIGMDEIFEVESTWNENAGEAYNDQISSLAKIMSKKK